VRARRDTELLRLESSDFEELLRSNAGACRVLLGTLAEWLSRGTPASAARPKPPGTIAIISLDRAAAQHAVERSLETELRRLADIITLTPADIANGRDDVGHALAELLDRAERERDRVLLIADPLDPASDWSQACIRQADRVVALVDQAVAPDRLLALNLPDGSDVVLLGGDSDSATDLMLRALEPRAIHRVRPDATEDDVARLARRLLGRSVGLVLSGGGARSFAHLGAIEELFAAGITIDRVAGTSMGAFIGALVAQGLNPAEIDARCYEEWVRRSPLGDYHFPRTSLIRGARARAMLERVLPGRIEDLKLGFWCVTVDLISARPFYHRYGPLAPMVGASMNLPGVVAPFVSEGRLLLDGGLMDNLPTEVMASEGDGPIIAVDASAPSVRRLPDGVDPEVPSLAETLFKTMLLSESDSDRRRSFADLLIRPDCSDIGTVEFHMLDAARDAGRRAAAATLAAAPDFVAQISAT
jgi:predicted acylesterase/phospholipase RssA